MEYCYKALAVLTNNAFDITGREKKSKDKNVAVLF
jgi:hypothetical protein